MGEYGDLIGFVAFVLFLLQIIACFKIVSSRASGLAKVIWILVVLFLPALGLLAWLLAGPSSPVKR